MSSARLSPTANLLRKSRVFSLPPALSLPPSPPTSRAVFESDTATLPYPTRAAIATPGSSLSKGDWGLKRPLPAKSTSQKSSRPVVRVVEQDTFEHVTDFESASDHVMTLEKLQDLNMPMSLLHMKDFYSPTKFAQHRSPFEDKVDNTENSEGRHERNAKLFRQTGPFLAGMTDAEFTAYFKKIQREKPGIARKLRSRVEADRLAQLRRKAQDNGEDLESLPSEMSDEEYMTTIRALRADPSSLGPLIYEVLDLPTPPAISNEHIRYNTYGASATNLSTIEYAKTGPPRTHPSAGVSYQRTTAHLHNHPQYGPQAFPRPVEARILRPRGRFKGRRSRAIAGIGGIAVGDASTTGFTDQSEPVGMGSFDASVPGGAKYWVTPHRMSVESDGKINITSFPASASNKAPYGLEDYKKPTPSSISEIARGGHRTVPRLDRARFATRETRTGEASGTEDVTRNLMKTLGGS